MFSLVQLQWILLKHIKIIDRALLKVSHLKQTAARVHFQSIFRQGKLILVYLSLNIYNKYCLFVELREQISSFVIWIHKKINMNSIIQNLKVLLDRQERNSGRPTNRISSWVWGIPGDRAVNETGSFHEFEHLYRVNRL